MKLVSKKTKVPALPVGENCMILSAFVFIWYWRVTDGWTDIQTAMPKPKLRCSIVQHDKNNSMHMVQSMAINFSSQIHTVNVAVKGLRHYTTGLLRSHNKHYNIQIHKRQ